MQALLLIQVMQQQKDVLELINYTKQVVKQKTGYEIQEEIEIIGEK